MKTSGQIADGDDSRKLAEFLSREGQLLLPVLQLIEKGVLAVDKLIDITGWATVEAVLLTGAEQAAGPRSPAKRHGEARWHGRQDAVVGLSQRDLRVSEPRPRKKGERWDLEVAVGAQEALRLGLAANVVPLDRL